MDRLKQFRKEKGLSQRAMAQSMGVTLSMYEKVETGRAHASSAFMARVKKAYPDANIDKIFFSRKGVIPDTNKKPPDGGFNRGIYNAKSIDDLCRLAERHKIIVDRHCPVDIAGICFYLPNGKKAVSIAPSIAFSEETWERCTELDIFAHEMGHCMTNSFYKEHWSPAEKAECENRANAWAVNYLIPFDDLCAAMKNGCRELGELARLFGVSYRFMKKAIQIHQKHGHVTPTVPIKA